MSKLNQAFIKAYQRRGIAAPHIPLPAAAAPMPAPATATVAVAVLPNAAGQIFSPPACAPAPEVGSQSTRGETEAEPNSTWRADVRQTPLVPSSHLRGKVAPGPGKPEAPRVEAAIAKEKSKIPSIAVRPAYEVERFEWPPIVGSLLERSEAELTALISELLPGGRGTLLVTGCRRSEGRTSVALLIARHLARSGKRTVLVDADFARPKVAASLATEAEHGWEEIAADAGPNEALIESLQDRLVILPLRQPVAELSLSASQKQVLTLLRNAYDVVCIDSGPFEADTGHVGKALGEPPLEAAVVVRDVRHCRLEQSHAVGRKLAQSGVGCWAIIENFV